jgi:hypothetical protein
VWAKPEKKRPLFQEKRPQDGAEHEQKEKKNSYPTNVRQRPAGDHQIGFEQKENQKIKRVIERHGDDEQRHRGDEFRPRIKP